MLTSGYKINNGKTTLLFGKSVSLLSKNAIKNLLGVLEIKEYERYLGLPVVVGKNRRASLNYIQERFGVSFRGGRKNYFPKRVGKCY